MIACETAAPGDAGSGPDASVGEVDAGPADAGVDGGADAGSDSGLSDGGAVDGGTDAGLRLLSLPSCQQLSALWLSRYHNALHAQWPATALDCADASTDRAFAEAAFVLEQTRFRADGLDGGYELPPTDMLAFVSNKYVGLTVDPGATYPYTDVGAKVLHFYPAVAKETGFEVVGNLIHEARHADGLAYLHVACTDGPNVGATVCDTGLSESFSGGGSHSIALLYFAWVAARSNWPAPVKAPLRPLADWLIAERLNTSMSERARWRQKYLVDF